MKGELLEYLSQAWFITMALTTLTISVYAQQKNLSTTEGIFKPTFESLKQYRYPE